MKFLKHFLLIGTMCTALTALHAQESPPIKQRGNSTFQQVDDYLIAVKRLGIPTGTQDDLNAVVAAPNTAKLMFRTDLNRLRVYNPVTQVWGDASPVDFSNYYSKQKMDTLLTGYVPANAGSWYQANNVGINISKDIKTTGQVMVRSGANGEYSGTTIGESYMIVGGTYAVASNPEYITQRFTDDDQGEWGLRFYKNGANKGKLAYIPPGVSGYQVGDYKFLTQQDIIHAPKATSAVKLLARDSVTSELRQIDAGALGLIQASPVIPQTADINLNGSMFLSNTTGININRGSNANAINIWNGADDNTLISATIIGTQIGDGTVAGRLYKDRLIFAQNQKGNFTLAISPPIDGVSANRAIFAPDNSGEIALVPVGEYSDNADALAGGLKIGQLYRTGDIVKVVH